MYFETKLWLPLSYLKGQLKAKISNFPTFFFGKPNIRKVKFLELFLFVSCFLRENYFRSWAFSAFPAFSVRAQKLYQQPAVTYDMGNRDFVMKRNKVNTSAAVDIPYLSVMFLRGLNIHDKTVDTQNTASMWGALACLPRIIRHKLQK